MNLLWARLLWFHSDVTAGLTEIKWDIRKQLSINIVCLFSIRMKKIAVLLCYIIYFLKHKKDPLFSVIHLSLKTQKSQVHNLYQLWFIHMHFALPFPPYLLLVVSVHLPVSLQFWPPPLSLTYTVTLHVNVFWHQWWKWNQSSRTPIHVMRRRFWCLNIRLNTTLLTHNKSLSFV